MCVLCVVGTEADTTGGSRVGGISQEEAGEGGPGQEVGTFNTVSVNQFITRTPQKRCQSGVLV